MDVVDSVVRDMLDEMRNAHLQLVLGDPYRALDCVGEAAAAHARLAVLFQGDPKNEALTGRILYQVIGQRMEALRSLAKDSLNTPMTSAEVIAHVAKPLGSAVSSEDAVDIAPTQEPPIG